MQLELQHFYPKAKPLQASSQGFFRATSTTCIHVLLMHSIHSMRVTVGRRSEIHRSENKSVSIVSTHTVTDSDD